MFTGFGDHGFISQPSVLIYLKLVDWKLDILLASNLTIVIFGGL